MEEMLNKLLIELHNIDPFDWNGEMSSWIAKAKPVVRKFCGVNYVDFEAATKAPSWFYLPRVASYVTGESNDYDASLVENRENNKIAYQAKDKIAATLKTLIELNQLSVSSQITRVEDSKKPSHANTVFIAYGKSPHLKDATARLMATIGCSPIILDEQKDDGSTIIEKLAEHSNAEFAIVLLTADDKGGLATDSQEKLQFRARQNVVFELGYFLGKLGRDRVCALKDERVEVPSNYSGVVYINVDSTEEWKFKLARRLKQAGLNVDLNRLS